VINVDAINFLRQLARELSDGNFLLPVFPATGVRIAQAVNDPDATITQIAGIVMTEPSLTARLLRIANSVAMRRGHMEITDVPDAISRIGLRTVLNVAVALVSRQAFPIDSKSAAMEAFTEARDQSLEVAVVAWQLARDIRNVGRPEDAMLVGLLHNVGKYYILMRVAEFSELFEEPEHLRALMVKWHAGVAHDIVGSWGFTQPIVRAVAELEQVQRDPQAPADTSDILLLARQLVMDAQRNDPFSGVAALPSLTRVGLDVGALRAMLDRGSEDRESLRSTLGP